MTNDEIKEALIAAQTALVEKIGTQPYIGLTLQLSTSGKWVCGNAYLDMQMTEGFGGPYAETPEEAISGVVLAIAKLPSQSEAGLRRFQKKVAEAIDLGKEVGVDALWLNPLVETARKLAENAITYDRAPHPEWAPQ